MAFFAVAFFAEAFFAEAVPDAFFAEIFSLAASLLLAVFFTAPFSAVTLLAGAALFVAFAVFLPPSGPCSPTAESPRALTRAAPQACAPTGDLDTRPAYGPAPTSAPDPEDRRPIGPLPRTPGHQCGILVTDHTVWTVRQNGHHGPLVHRGNKIL
ncbi:hypothetical protein GCM10010424_29540 [Streptomyces lienomycini]